MDDTEIKNEIPLKDEPVSENKAKDISEDEIVKDEKVEDVLEDEIVKDEKVEDVSEDEIVKDEKVEDVSEDKAVDEENIEDISKEEKHKKVQKKEKEEFVFTKVAGKQVAIVIPILIVCAVLEILLMSREGLVGVIRLISIPITIGIFASYLIYVVINRIAAAVNKAQQILTVFSEFLIFIIVVGIGYSLLVPIKDIKAGTKNKMVDLLSQSTYAQIRTVRVTSDGNGITESKYHLYIEDSEVKDAAPEYDFEIDKSTYESLKKDSKAGMSFLRIYYYDNTNTFVKYKDETDTVLGNLTKFFSSDSNKEDDSSKTAATSEE